MAYRSLTQQMLHYFARPHEVVPTEPIGGPAAWTVDDFDADSPAWRIELTSAQADEVHAAVAHARATGKPTQDLVAADLPLPSLPIDAWREQLTDGRGFVVIRGVPVDRWNASDQERFFWAFGRHLGIPGAQNPDGDLLGHVRDQGFDDQTQVRAYRTRTRIRFHCDAADVVGLLCLRAAASGGASRIASSVTVFDRVLRARPDLAPLLFEPYLLDTKAEGGLRHFPIAPSRFAEGRLRTFYHADYFRSVTRHADVAPLTPDQLALLDVYDAVADEVALSMQLAPGDIQLLNNHTMVHSREAFVDGDHKRHLLRLWLSLEDRPRGKRRAWLGMVGRLAVNRLRQR